MSPPVCTFVYEAMCLYRIGDIGLRQFFDGPASVKLRELNLANCSLLGDTSVIRLSER